MASVIYNEYKKEVGKIDWETDIFKVLLVDSGYIVDIVAHSNLDDVTNEVSGTGYTAGGKLLANKTITRDDTQNWSVYDADDSIWPNSTITARAAIIYLDTGTPATSTLLTFADLVVDKSSNGGDFVVQWHTEGVFKIV